MCIRDRYLIAFNDEWVPELTSEQLRERGTAARALIQEMTDAGVFIFSDGGLDASTAVCSVDPSSGSPVFTDGPFTETKEALGGYYLIEAADLDQALEIAKLCPAPFGGVEVRPVMDMSGSAG